LNAAIRFAAAGVMRFAFACAMTMRAIFPFAIVQFLSCFRRGMI
jgi:hypothetical protein